MKSIRWHRKKGGWLEDEFLAGSGACFGKNKLAVSESKIDTKSNAGSLGLGFTTEFILGCWFETFQGPINSEFDLNPGQGHPSRFQTKKIQRDTCCKNCFNQQIGLQIVSFKILVISVELLSKLPKNGSLFQGNLLVGEL